MYVFHGAVCIYFFLQKYWVVDECDNFYWGNLHDLRLKKKEKFRRSFIEIEVNISIRIKSAVFVDCSEFLLWSQRYFDFLPRIWSFFYLLSNVLFGSTWQLGKKRFNYSYVCLSHWLWSKQINRTNENTYSDENKNRVEIDRTNVKAQKTKRP